MKSRVERRPSRSLGQTSTYSSVTVAARIALSAPLAATMLTS
jgi:hypothetical protein